MGNDRQRKEVRKLINSLHFCTEHRTKFYENKKQDPVTGELKVWFSHKRQDGTGFCTEKAAAQPKQLEIPTLHSVPSNNITGMYACNAMNNAVALASSGKIEIGQIDSYFRKILSSFSALA